MVVRYDLADCGIDFQPERTHLEGFQQEFKYLLVLRALAIRN